MQVIQITVKLLSGYELSSDCNGETSTRCDTNHEIVLLNTWSSTDQHIELFH